MKIGETYRLKKDILAVHCESARTHPVLRPVPAGALVTITETLLEDLRMVAVSWGGTIVAMFATDLKLRGHHGDSP